MEFFERIRDRIDEPLTHFVFPSELTARFWCKRALRFTGRMSVPAGRFVSWDQFKKSCFSYPSPGRPANRAVRLLFAERQLERNRRSPFLRRIVPPQYAEQPRIFLESVQRFLPVLHRLPALRSRWPRFSRDKLQDLEEIHERYAAFLKASGLYEPNYEIPEYSPGSRRAIIFFPELIEDYGEFADLLSGTIETVRIPPDMRPGTSVRVYQTLPEEIRAAIRRIAALLDGGIAADEIVLTVGQLGELEPTLRREAEMYGIPLQLHQGKPLSEFPQALMLHKAHAAVQSSFNLNAMKELLLCRSIPWKQEALCRILIRLGVDGRIAGNTPTADSWVLSFETCRRNGNKRRLPLRRVSRFYATLKHQLIRIAAARAFSELKSALVEFSADFLDLSRLNEEEVKIFQFALDTLDELEQADEPIAETGGPRQHPVFLIWWSYLEQRLYVPARNVAGIPVHPFRVSAGMAPEHHIVINASQASTSHTIRRYPFLKLHEERNIPEVQRELAPGYLRLYSHSGVDVQFSYARRDYQRTNLPPAVFLTQNVPIDEIGASGAQDAYELEREAWIHEGSFPLQEMQKTGYAAAEAGALGSKDVDAEFETLKDEHLIHTLAERLQDEESRFRISATALERFTLCPFRFLWERLLRLGEQEYEPSMIDPIDLGVLLHRGLELFFSRARSEGPDSSGTLSADRREEYRACLQDIVSGICRDHRRQNPALLAPIASEIQRKVEELLLAFLDVELEIKGDEQVEGIEVRLAVPAPDIDAILVGTVDRIDRNPDGYTLIDYKKRYVPTRGELFAREPVSLQMPFYIHLMELAGRSVTRAAYYSFENRRYHYLFGGPKTNMATAAEAHRSAAEVPRRILEMQTRISTGDFRNDDSATAGCRYCSLRGICRSGYSLGG